MRKDKGRIALVAVLAVFVSSILVLLYWDFVRDTIVVPIYYLLWISDLALKSIPQGIYLVGLVLVSTVIGLNTLERTRVNEATRTPDPHQRQLDTRYSFWRQQVLNLQSSAFAREKFVTEAGKLIVSVLAYREGVTSAEAEALIREGSLTVPKAISELLREKDLRVVRRGPSLLEKTVFGLGRLLLKQGPPRDSQIDQQVAEIIGFIERELEITHAGRQPDHD